MGMCESRDQIPDTQFGRSTIQPKMSENPNVDFYRGVYPFSLNQSIVFHIKHWQSYNQPHQWIKFYSDLESDRQFMQWLYPNFYQSFFNTTSFRLTIVERNLFISDKEIAKHYKENVQMFQRFLGIARNQDNQLEIIDDTQFDQCIYSYTHNQVRIQRFLSSMSILGSRQEALEFLQILSQKLTTVYKTKFEGFQLLEEEIDDSAQSIVTKTKPTRKFIEVKDHYVQSDLLNEPWVTPLILTPEPIIHTQVSTSFVLNNDI